MLFKMSSVLVRTKAGKTGGVSLAWGAPLALALAPQVSPVSEDSAVKPRMFGEVGKADTNVTSGTLCCPSPSSRNGEGNSQDRFSSWNVTPDTAKLEESPYESSQPQT